MKKWERRLLFAGISIIGISIVWPPLSLFLSPAFLDLDGVGSDGGGGGTKVFRGYTMPNGEVELRRSPVVYVNDPFWIELKIDFQGGTKDQMLSRANNTQFRLTGSGLTGQPTDWQRIWLLDGTAAGEISWAFKSSAEGGFPITIDSKAVDPKIDSIPVHGRIEINVKGRFWNYFTYIWPIFSGFFGAFLTLPGILSFLSQRKKDREERQASKAAKTAQKVRRPGYAGEIETKEGTTGKKELKADKKIKKNDGRY